jgi:hypothetical protein
LRKDKERDLRVGKRRWQVIDLTKMRFGCYDNRKFLFLRFHLKMDSPCQ